MPRDRPAERTKERKSEREESWWGVRLGSASIFHYSPRNIRGRLSVRAGGAILLPTALAKERLRACNGLVVHKTGFGESLEH